MKKKLYWSVGILLLLGTIWVGTFSWIGGGADMFDCADEVISKKMSPNGEYEAITYFRDCGATTSISTHSGIERQGFFSDIEDFLVVDGKIDVDMSWMNENTLAISSSSHLSKSNSDVYLLKEEVGNTKIQVVKPGRVQ